MQHHGREFWCDILQYTPPDLFHLQSYCLSFRQNLNKALIDWLDPADTDSSDIIWSNISHDSLEPQNTLHNFFHMCCITVLDMKQTRQRQNQSRLPDRYQSSGHNTDLHPVIKAHQPREQPVLSHSLIRGLIFCLSDTFDKWGQWSMMCVCLVLC